MSICSRHQQAHPDCNLCATEFPTRATVCYVRCVIEPGLHPDYPSVLVPTTSGHAEEVSVPQKWIIRDSVALDYVGERKEAVLVEFPVEASSGAWRAWVPWSEVVSINDHQRL